MRFTSATLILLAGSSATADQILVPQDAPTIQAAVDMAGDGDEILVAAGEYIESVSVSRKSIVLSGAGAVDTCVDANGANFCINVSEGNVSISGFKLVGADIRALRMSDGNLSVLDCVMTDSVGGVSLEPFARQSAVLLNCVIAGNSGKGGIGCQGFGRVDLIGCEIDSNSGSTVGGIGVFSSLQLSIIDCVISNNEASQGGSGIRLVSVGLGETVISNTDFVANAAPLDIGGALFVSNGQAPEFTGCRFLDNMAYFGGAVVTDNFSRPVFVECEFRGNSATYLGGASLAVDFGTPEFSLCTFENNTSQGPGKDVVNASPGVSTLQDSWFCLPEEEAVSGAFIDAGGNVFNAACGCSADISGDDGAVTAGDLATLLGGWGQAGVGDLDEDGTTGPADLAILLGEWGECD